VTQLTRRFASAARDVPAGVLDAAISSLAHFLVGLASVNLLGEASLGVYAVFFASFLVATIVPQFLVFTPAEVVAVSYPMSQRLSQVTQSLRLGVGPTLAGALAVVVAAVATRGETTADVTIALATTAGVAVLVSPAQDHVRRLLHIGGQSWGAVAVSTVQLVTVAVGLGAMSLLDIPAPWIPFGALAIANIVSLSFATAFARARSAQGTSDALSFTALVRSGRWLLVMALVPFGASFIGTILIVELAGPEAMGFAEAARVAAQPILVAGTGLSAVLGPRGIEAAIQRNFARARRVQHLFLGLVVGGGLLYLLVAGHPWVGNPMVYLVPRAYEVTGLVAVTIVAHTITAAAVQYGSELMGGRKEVELMRMSLIASPLLLVGSATAAVTQSFARALGIILEGSVRYGLYGVARGRMYRDSAERAAASMPD
jgi:hypothetical protein